MQKNFRAIVNCCNFATSALSATMSPAFISSGSASEGPTVTDANSSLLMSLDDMGVPGRDKVRLWCLEPGVCPPKPTFSALRNDDVLEMGGVAGISPVTLARASTPRESIFIAVSGSKLSASQSLFVVSGEGMPVTFSLGSWGTRPASCEGLGAEGGEVIGDEGGSAMMCNGQI